MSRNKHRRGAFAQTAQVNRTDSRPANSNPEKIEDKVNGIARLTYAIASYTNQTEADKKAQARREVKRLRIDVTTLIMIGVYTALTLSLAVIGFLQLRIAKKSMFASQRAFVTAGDVVISNQKDDEGKILYWIARPQLVNSGSTPTQRMRVATGIWQLPGDPPDTSNLIEKGTMVSLGPHGTYILGNIPISQEIMREIASVPMQFFGTASYFDIFPGSALHVTQFCFVLYQTVGSYWKGGTRSDLGSAMCPTHNCTDDECSVQPTSHMHFTPPPANPPKSEIRRKSDLS